MSKKSKRLKPSHIRTEKCEPLDWHCGIDIDALVRTELQFFLQHLVDHTDIYVMSDRTSKKHVPEPHLCVALGSSSDDYDPLFILYIPLSVIAQMAKENEDREEEEEKEAQALRGEVHDAD